MLKRTDIRKFLKKKYHLIINCAAIGRMRECEKNPLKAIRVNIFGTLNLIKEILNFENNYKKKINLIHISTDGVYPSIKGNYSEKSKLKPKKKKVKSEDEKEDKPLGVRKTKKRKTVYR